MFGIELDGPTLFIIWGGLSAAAVMWMVMCEERSLKQCLFNSKRNPVDNEE